MTWFVVAAAAVAVVVIALTLRDPQARRRSPRPGEELPRHDPVANVPDGYVTIRPALVAEEAYVAHGLLLAGGIAAELREHRSMPHAYTRQPPAVLSLLVPEDQAAEAETLLREQVVADAGDVGSE